MEGAFSLTSLLPAIEDLGYLSYWLLFLMAFLESLPFLGVFFPGTVFVLFAGFLASQGFFSATDLFWFVASGTLIGESCSYLLGRHGHGIFWKRSIKEEYLVRGKNFFDRYGSLGLILAKFVGPLRGIVPFIAGWVRMEKWLFAIFAVLGSAVWAGTFISLGYFFGEAWKSIEVWATRVGIFLFLLVVLIGVAYAVRMYAIKKGKNIPDLFRLLIAAVKNALENSRWEDLYIKTLPLFVFLKNRFLPISPLGLPLTASFILVFILFFSWTGAVHNMLSLAGVERADTAALNFFTNARHTLLTEFFSAVTFLGNRSFIALLFLWASALFIIEKWWHKLFALWAVFLGSLMYVYIGKAIIARARPEESFALLFDPSFSFPSSHAISAAALYGLLTYLFAKKFPNWKTKVNIFFVWFLLSVAISISRLYLGVHYFSDVVGGYMIGLLWLAIGIGVFEILEKRGRKEHFFDRILEMVFTKK